MNLNDILHQADLLFQENKPRQAGEYLEEMAGLAYEQKHYGAALSLFNELTGYYRNSGDLDGAWACAEKLLALLDRLDLWGTADGATVLLNIATVYKAARLPEKALCLYLQCEDIFRSQGIADARLVGLYNNICVSSMEMARYEDALLYGEKALCLSKQLPMAEDKKALVRENYCAAKQAVEQDGSKGT